VPEDMLTSKRVWASLFDAQKKTQRWGIAEVSGGLYRNQPVLCVANKGRCFFDIHAVHGV
jgi:hypothetical protein